MDFHPVSNSILANLPDQLLAQLKPRLHALELPVQKVLYLAGETIEHAYFLEQGMVSLVKPLEDGSMVEVGVIGREGFVGVPLIHGATSDTVEAMVQIEGSGLLISAAGLHEEIGRSAALQAHLLLFAHSLQGQICQTAACNQRHHLNERLARWLLMARDRLDADILPLKHEFLSMMLGSRRAGITVALGAFREAGIIRTMYREIEILDREALEAASCECYSAVKQHHAPS